MLKLMKGFTFVSAMLFMGGSLAGGEQLVSEKAVSGSWFSWVEVSPSPIIEWLTFGVAGAAFLWNFVPFVINLAHRRAQRRISIIDEFWYRSVLVPVCLDPLLSFVDKYSERLKDISAEHKDSDAAASKPDYDQFLRDFKREKERHVSRFIITNALSESIYGTVSNELDSLDDVVTLHCALKSLEPHLIGDNQYPEYYEAYSYFYSTAQKIIATFITNHESHVRQPSRKVG